ncbi:MAG: hypothetical protein ACM3N1_00230 [Accumulibacter sp.]
MSKSKGTNKTKESRTAESDNFDFEVFPDYELKSDDSYEIEDYEDNGIYKLSTDLQREKRELFPEFTRIFYSACKSTIDGFNLWNDDDPIFDLETQRMTVLSYLETLLFPIWNLFLYNENIRAKSHTEYIKVIERIVDFSLIGTNYFYRLIPNKALEMEVFENPKLIVKYLRLCERLDAGLIGSPYKRKFIMDIVCSIYNIDYSYYDKDKMTEYLKNFILLYNEHVKDIFGDFSEDQLKLHNSYSLKAFENFYRKLNERWHELYL